MEEYRNRVIKSHAINPRILANLLAKLTRKNPRCMGAMGGAYPLRASPRLYLALLSQGPEALYATQSWNLAVSMNAQGPMAPCWGGKDTREEALHRGVGVSPLPVPYVCPSQDGPPY